MTSSRNKCFSNWNQFDFDRRKLQYYHLALSMRIVYLLAAFDYFLSVLQSKIRLLCQSQRDKFLFINYFEQVLFRT